MIADAYEARGQRRAQGALPAAAAVGALSDQHRVGPSSWPRHPLRRLSPFHQEAGPGVVDLGAKLGRNFAAERAQDSVNLFEAAANHARRLIGEGKRVLFASWSEGASERLGAMLADHGLKDVRLRALLAGGQGRRPEAAAARRAAARRRLRDRQPGGHLRDRHPGRPAGAAAPAPPRRQLPGRGHRADARRPRRPHRPRHRPLRGPEDAGGAGSAARLPGDRLRGRVQALPAGREHRPPDPLRRRQRGGAARPPGRRGLAGAQGQGQGAAARDGRGPDRHRRPARAQARRGSRTRRTVSSTSSAPASPTRRPTTS